MTLFLLTGTDPIDFLYHSPTLKSNSIIPGKLLNNPEPPTEYRVES